MESFIRSKYESRRWAMERPPPSDPSVLEDPSTSSTPTPAVVQHHIPAVDNPTSRPNQSSSSARHAGPPPLTTRQPQPHQLLSTAVADRTRQSRIVPAAISQAVPPPPQPKAPENDLFALDFHAPVSSQATDTASSEPKKDVKNDILSLFSTPASQHSSAFGQFGSPPQHQQQDPWGQFSGSTQPQQQQVPLKSMAGSNGTGQWGTTSGWNAQNQVVPPAQGNLWGNPTSAPTQPTTFGSSNMWASATPAAPGVGGGGDLFSAPSTQRKDDVFGDLWGGFK
jgi:stromal membrane-associated protein